jgi:hypothetical protein
MRDIEGALGTKVAIDLPYDPFIYLKAVNEGHPSRPRSSRSSPPSASPSSPGPPSARTSPATVPVEVEEHQRRLRPPGGRRRRVLDRAVRRPVGRPRPRLSASG